MLYTFLKNHSNYSDLVYIFPLRNISYLQRFTSFYTFMTDVKIWLKALDVQLMDYILQRRLELIISVGIISCGESCFEIQTNWRLSSFPGWSGVNLEASAILKQCRYWTAHIHNSETHCEAPGEELVKFNASLRGTLLTLSLPYPSAFGNSRW